MAEDINKKISIDVEIGNDGQQQINQYKASFDNLRNSINALDKDLSSLTGSIDKLNSQSQSTSSSGNKLKESFESLSGTFKIWNEVVGACKEGLDLFKASISGGLTLLITFAPEILKFVTSLIKGKEAITQAKLSLDTLNTALQSSDYSNAIKQMNELKINVGLAKQGFLDKKEVLKQYNDTLGKTMGKTDDLNKVEAILVKKGGDYIKMTLLKAQAQLALQDAAKKAYEAEQEKIKPDDEVLTFWDKTVDVLKRVAGAGMGAAGAVGAWADADADRFDKANQRRKEFIADANTQKDQLLTLAADWEKQAAEIAKKDKFNLFGDTTTSSGNVKTKHSPKLKPNANENQSPLFPTPSQDRPDPDATAELNAAQEKLDEDEAQKKIQLGKQTIQQITDDAAKIKAEAQKKEEAARQALNKQIVDEAKQVAQQVANDALNVLSNNIKQQADAKVAALESQKNSELSNTNLTSGQKLAIEAKFKKQENQIKAKAFKEEQELSIAKATINGAEAITKVSAQSGVLAALEIGAVVAETAAQIAQIAAQKPPAYAAGGLHYTSDGKGGMLPGYSRTDNTNAYLRSGEGIVVSEAMRDPWARNLVSAINVGFGGRDFSTTATGRGFAVGGIFTDGGDANRYYNAPVNDQKNLANSIAYQMVNNFPPVYVDVKDINNQQNILAQTINRVNL